MSSIGAVRRPLNTWQPAHRWAEEIEWPLGYSRSWAHAPLTAPSMSASGYLVVTEIRGDGLSRGARLVETAPCISAAQMIAATEVRLTLPNTVRTVPT